MAAFVRALSAMVVGACAIAACAAPNESVEPASPLDVAVASAMTAKEIAKSKDPDTVYGWNLELVGERARFFACTDEHTCSERVVDLPAKSVVAVRHVGRVRPSRADGSELDETDVLRLTLARDVATSRGGIASDPHRGLTVGGPTKP